MQQAIRKTEIHHHTLPQGFQRGDVVRVLTAVAPRIGLGAGALRALLTMIHMTKPSDWTSGLATPICYKEQMKVAAAVGVTARTMRSYEASLEQMGLIQKTVGADGSRGRFGAGAVVYGLSFEPLIRQFPSLLEGSLAIDAEALEMEILRRRCSAARRSLTKAASQALETNPRHPDVLLILQTQADLPRRYEGLSRDDLERILSEVDRLICRARDLCLRSEDMSGAPENLDLPHIQDTTETESGICSGSTANDTTDRKRSEAEKRSAHSAENSLEKNDGVGERNGKPELDVTFSPNLLYRMASEDMQLYLDSVRTPGMALCRHHFVQASISILPALGVHPSAWDEAVEAMGDFAAALSVIVIDANRYHPTRPIHSPGAMLRTYSRLAQSGRLNLTGSLIGLKQRLK